MTWSKMRTEWRKARDEHGLKAGHVSGVSIGDAIDKIIKAEEKGYGTLLGAAKKLKADLVKYQSKLTKTKQEKDFSGWITKNIMKDVDGLIADVSADLKAVNELLDTARESVQLRAIVPEIELVSDTDGLMASDPGLSWSDALKKQSKYTLVVRAAKELSATAKAFQGIKFKHPLKKDFQKFLVDFGTQLQADIVFCVKWIGLDDRNAFVETLRTAKGRDWAFDKQSQLGKVFDFLKN